MKGSQLFDTFEQVRRISGDSDFTVIGSVSVDVEIAASAESTSACCSADRRPLR